MWALMGSWIEYAHTFGSIIIKIDILILNFFYRLQRRAIRKGAFEWFIQELQCSEQACPQWVLPHRHNFRSDFAANCRRGTNFECIMIRGSIIDDYFQDEKNQLLTTCMWFNLVWTDYQVKTCIVHCGGQISARFLDQCPSIMQMIENPSKGQ